MPDLPVELQLGDPEEYPPAVIAEAHRQHKPIGRAKERHVATRGKIAQHQPR